MPRLPTLVATVVVAGALVACGGGDDGGAEEGGPPNVVVILTDDQTLESLRVMTHTRQLLADEGTTFGQAVVSLPLCCPSRATLLTGQYAHNHHVTDNVPPDGGYGALDHTDTLPVWLQESGYVTSHVGKYLNSYTRQSRPAIPPGWDRWFALVDPSATRYVNYDVNDNGSYVHFGTADEDYQTDVLADRAVSEVERLAEGDDPFFLTFWPTAPHTGAGPGALPFSPAPAPRHLSQFADEPPLATPAVEEEDLSDKPPYVTSIAQSIELGIASYNAEQGTDLSLDELSTIARRRYLESLLAVDEAVERIITALGDSGELDDTLMLFTSDNGWMSGEHGISFAKVVAYEPSLRVPLLVRGPGFEAGARVDGLVSNLDLAPTILEATGVSPPEPLDGVSLTTDRDRPTAVLLESPPGGSGQIPHFTGVRTPRYSYVEYESGHVELYDLSTDPDQLTNVAADPGRTATIDTLAGLVDQLASCAGADCVVPAPPGT